MLSAIPNKKETELINSINQMVRSGIDRQRLEEIRFSAKKMQDMGGSYYSAAKRILGMAAALIGDVNECEVQFNAAFRHSGRTVDLLKAYSVSLWNLRQIRRNLEIVDELFELSPDNPEFVKTAIHHHWAAFDVEGTKRYIIHAEKLKLPLESLMTTFPISLELISKILEDTGSTWEQVCERVELTSNVLNRLGLHSTGIDSTLVDGIVLHDYKIVANVDSVIQAEDEMNDAIANMPFSPADKAIYFSCSAA